MSGDKRTSHNKDSDIVERARLFAEDAHGRINHRRKYTGLPYVEHLRAVANLVAGVTDDPETIAAAWLHDTVEDTPVTLRDIEAAFGPTLARLVLELTDVSRPGDGNRATRKAIDFHHLALASPRAKTVKLADLIDNCRDICVNDPGFGRIYITEMNALLGVLKEGDSRLYGTAKATLEECSNALGLPLSPEGYVEWTIEAPPKPLDARTDTTLRVFTRAFAARDIAEPLFSFDTTRDAGEARSILLMAGHQVAGVREKGAVNGFVGLTDLKEGTVGSCVRQFLPGQTLDTQASLSDVVSVLTRFTFCFLTLWGQVVGVISRGDIQKPIVRMWLFGMITLIEMKVTDRIERRWPDESWRLYVSEGRIKKAEELREERLRRGDTCRLLDCLQFSEKFQLLIEDKNYLSEVGFTSKAQGKRAIKRLESLRNHLAHSQDIVNQDWPLIAGITQKLESLVIW
jgi:hypothetical protein